MDFELSGDGALQEAFDDLEDDYAQEPVYVVGTNVEYAVFVERGTEHHPPYPFFAPAVREFKANPVAFIEDNTDTTVAEIDTTEELISSISFALQAQIQTNATAASSGRSPGTDPDHPQVDTGNLRASISAVKVR